MSGIIALSDSNESVLSVEFNDSYEKGDKEKRKSRDGSISSDDFNFPEVQFYDISAENRLPVVPEKNNIHPGTASTEQNSHVAYHENHLLVQSKEKRNTFSQKFSVHTLSDSYESDNDNNEKVQIAKETLGAKKTQKKDKNKLKEERAMRQEQLARQKALKTIASKRLHNSKPGECMKYMEIIFDEALTNDQFQVAFHGKDTWKKVVLERITIIIKKTVGIVSY
ncbi:hypothetical protein KM043_006269 [Ampulex compressa]|nr:hypothetical protein KM043_006269 [Ampulex compressa]